MKQRTFNTVTRASALALALFFGCSTEPSKDQPEPKAVERLDDLKAVYAINLGKAKVLRDPVNGWLAVTDCDAMIWTGKYGASRGVFGVVVSAAEYPGSPGKYGRRPPPWCWTKDLGDQGSKSEWSRDMAVAGLFPYAWMTNQREVLEEHAAYGKKHHWMMGEPLGDGRTIYSPTLIGLLYKLIAAMGGKKDATALWPDVWPSGLEDFEAHLQVMSIWLQGEAAERLGDHDHVPRRPAEGQALTTSISGTMWQRLEEHAKREPNNPLYQAVYGLYSGDLNPATRVLLDPLMPVGSYVRCSVFEECQLAEWLFAASIVLDKVSP